MSMLTRWNPFRATSPLSAVPDVDDFFRSFGLRALPRELTAAPDIRIDVSEDEGSYRIKADIPGVDKDAIEVAADGNLITIGAELRKQKEGASETELYSERSVGRAYRAFTLPGEVEQDKAEARYENGVLTLVLPKKANGQNRRITIS